jgi:hypothetical protein
MQHRFRSVQFGARDFISHMITSGLEFRGSDAGYGIHHYMAT